MCEARNTHYCDLTLQQSERPVALPLPQPVVLPPPQPIVLPVLQLEEESSRVSTGVGFKHTTQVLGVHAHDSELHLQCQVLLQDGEPPNLMAAGSCGGKGNDSKDKGGEGGGHRENGSHDSHSSDEVDEFYTLLDTTLHLPEHSAVKPPREDVPLPRVAFSEPEGEKFKVLVPMSVGPIPLLRTLVCHADVFR